MCIGQIFVRQSAKRHFAIWSILWALYNTHEDFIKTENTILARCCIKIQNKITRLAFHDMFNDIKIVKIENSYSKCLNQKKNHLSARLHVLMGYHSTEKASKSLYKQT